ncbi:response regulator [Streptomyces sp. NPDC087440]|uniref:response regulator n=1 Tax=Streptomyces sp. NPDC087440 TaxID=3365790 RepID=UPI0037F2C8D9
MRGRAAVPMVKVMVVDDDELLRHGLQRILESADDIRVSAACDGPDAVAQAELHRPDVALVDVHMPGVDGLSVLAALRGLAAPPAVAMLTGFGTAENVARALTAGAVGFFLKGTAAQELIPGVRLLAAGGSALSSRVTHSVVRPALGPATGRPGVPPGTAAARLGGGQLTDRERDVLVLLATGMTNAEIAGRLFLSRSTVKDHVSSVLAKLGATNRIQAAVLAQSLVDRRAATAPETVGGTGQP